jgi:tetratricopeptide (TPR) repeat protein
MSLFGKWYGFGTSAAFDDALRAYEGEQWDLAVEGFAQAAGETKDPALKEQARFYLAESHAKLARQAMLEERPEDAEKHLRAALEIQQGYADLHLRLGVALAHKGDSEGAKASFNRALELNPNYAQAGQFRELLEQGKPIPKETESESRGRDANALANQADDAAAEGNHDEAAGLFRRAIEIAPSYPDLRCRFGQVLLAKDELDAALEQLDEAVRLNPRYAEAHAQRGIALRRLRKPAEAKEAFKKALEFDPKHLIAGLELGRRSSGS